MMTRERTLSVPLAEASNLVNQLDRRSREWVFFRAVSGMRKLKETMGQPLVPSNRSLYERAQRIAFGA